jgi:hypothetical protein
VPLKTATAFHRRDESCKLPSPPAVPRLLPLLLLLLRWSRLRRPPPLLLLLLLVVVVLLLVVPRMCRPELLTGTA